jgi:hypothetical protein
MLRNAIRPSESRAPRFRESAAGGDALHSRGGESAAEDEDPRNGRFTMGSEIGTRIQKNACAIYLPWQQGRYTAATHDAVAACTALHCCRCKHILFRQFLVVGKTSVGVSLQSMCYRPVGVFPLALLSASGCAACSSSGSGGCLRSQVQ